MDPKDGLLLAVQTKREVLVETFEVVDAGLGVDLLCVGGDEWRSYFLAAQGLVVILIDHRALKLAHSNLT